MRPLLIVHLIYTLFTLPFVVSADPTITLPKPKADTTPAPKPPPIPVGIPILTGDTLYVIESKTECVIKQYPVGMVKITKSGPLTIRAKFIDGTGVNELRKYAGPYVYLLEAEPTANGKVGIAVIPIGFKSEAEIVTDVIDVKGGQAPQPPPKPDPPTPPKPEPTKAAWVIIVEETDQRTPEVSTILGNDEMWSRIVAKGAKWRIYDINSPNAKRNNYDVPAKELGIPAVLLLDNSGKILSKFKLPKTSTELEDLIK